MPRMLVASSPVEIEAKAEEAGFPDDAHDAAAHLFHALTDQLGQATAALGALHEDWPNHRFYFGTPGGEMSALLDGLQARPDLLDITAGTPAAPAPGVAGLFARREDGRFVAVLVGHRNQAGLVSTSARPG